MFRIRLSHHTAIVMLHDASVFGAAFLATGVLDGTHHLTSAALTAAAITAVKVAVRGLLPAPAALAELERLAGSILEAVPVAAPVQAIVVPSPAAPAVVAVPTVAPVVEAAPAPVVAPVVEVPAVAVTAAPPVETPASAA